jgi:hypothetical protein
MSVQQDPYLVMPMSLQTLVQGSVHASVLHNMSGMLMTHDQ